METVTIKNSIITGVTSTLLFLFFVLLSVFFFYFPNQPILNFIGVFGIIIFSFLEVASLVSTFDRKPRIIINNDGIYDRT